MNRVFALILFSIDKFINIKYPVQPVLETDVSRSHANKSYIFFKVQDTILTNRFLF